MNQKKHYTVALRTAFLLFFGLFLCEQYSLSAEVLTMERALEIAMSNSPDIKQTELSLEQSQEFLNAQKASLKSNFSLRFNPFSYSSDRTFDDFFSTWNTTESTSSSGTFTISQPIKEIDGTLALINTLSWRDSYTEYRDLRSKTYDNNLYISYQQPLFTYNRTKMELRELELDIENAQYSYEIQKLALEQNVTQNFYNVYQRKTDLDIALEELDNQKQSYEIIKNKVEAGLSAEEELYQAELNLANSELAVQNNREALDNILDSFKFLLGISIYEDIDIDSDITHKAVEVDLDKALNIGLKTRRELRQREIDIEEALNNLTRTAALNEFNGSLTLSYGIIGTNEQFNNIFDDLTKRQSIGLIFDIPLWDWGEKKSRIKASEAGIKRQHISLEDERNTIILAIRRAHRNLQKLVSQIEIARQNVRNAQLTYDINLERYKNGDLTSMDLNLYQAQLSATKQGLVGTLINYKLALLDIKILSLWDFENDQPALLENIKDLI